MPSVASLVATLAVLICLAGFVRTFDYSFRGNDDTVYLYLTGLELFHGAETAPLHQVVQDYLSQQRVGEQALARWKLRADYARNYLVPSTLIYLSSRVLKPVMFGFQANYGLFVVLSLALGSTLSFVISLSLLRWAVVSAPDIRTCLGILLGLAIVVALLLVPEGRILSMSVTEGPLHAVWHLVWVFFSPDSILGYAPRNQFYLCATVVFLLRWRERWTAAYALTIALSLVHQSLAGLLLVLLVALDVAAQPKIFDRWTLALVMIGLAVFFVRDTLFTTLHLWPAIVAGAILVVAAGTAAAAFHFGLRLPLWEAIERRAVAPLQRRLDRLGPIGSDLVLMFGLWLATLPIAMIMVAIADQAAAYHFWGEIHVRGLALLQPVALIGLSILAVGWLDANLVIDRRWLYGAVVAVATLLAVPAAVQAIIHNDAGLLRAAAALNGYNALIGKPLPALDVQTGEAVVYYAMAMELDLQTKVVDQMLFRWPQPPRQ